MRKIFALFVFVLVIASCTTNNPKNNEIHYTTINNEALNFNEEKSLQIGFHIQILEDGNRRLPLEQHLPKRVWW